MYQLSVKKRTCAVQLGMSALPPIATSIASALLWGSQLIMCSIPRGSEARRVYGRHTRCRLSGSGGVPGNTTTRVPTWNSTIEVHDIFIREADTARRYERTDGRWLVGAVNTIDRATEVKRAHRADRFHRPP